VDLQLQGDAVQVNRCTLVCPLPLQPHSTAYGGAPRSPAHRALLPRQPAVRNGESPVRHSHGRPGGSLRWADPLISGSSRGKVLVRSRAGAECSGHWKSWLARLQARCRYTYSIGEHLSRACWRVLWVRQKVEPRFRTEEVKCAMYRLGAPFWWSADELPHRVFCASTVLKQGLTGLLLRPHPLACSHALKFLKTEQLDRQQFVRGLPRTARSAAAVKNRREVARFPRLHALVPRCLPAENGQGGTSRVAVQPGATVAEEVQKPSAAWNLAALR